jgi:hypothetical protein
VSAPGSLPGLPREPKPWTWLVRTWAMTLMGFAAVACGDGPSGLVDERDCAHGGILSLQPGDAVRGDMGRRRVILCIHADQAGEYAWVPFIGDGRDTLLRVDLLIGSEQFLVDSTPFVASQSLLDGPSMAVSLSTSALTSREGQVDILDGVTRATDLFHMELREAEHRLLRARPSSNRLGARGEPQALRAAGPPSVGDTVVLSVSAICGAPDLRAARVAAVSDHAVVMEDLSNPVGGFDAPDLQAFADEYDDVVHAALVPTFGSPTDLDGNGRVILFFTRGVNEKTPAGGTGIVAGYFWGGDLFPVDAGGRLSPCASSNEGEILYLAVPDPTGSVTGRSVSRELLLSVTASTMGHELQHLVNAARRLHMNPDPSMEETWLNEGLSLIAEELLFYAASGLSPRSNLDAASLRATPALTAAFNRFQAANVGRLNLHLQAARSSSALARDGLETRGATWSFLRYAADRDPGSDEVLFGRLVGGTSVGLANLESVLGPGVGLWMADWSASLLTDDLIDLPDPAFTQPSWNMRGLIPALRLDRRYPIQLLGLHGPATYLVRLRPAGAAAYTAFRLPAGRSDVTVEIDSSSTGTVRYTLVRVN